MSVKKIPFQFALSLTALSGSNDLRICAPETGWMYCIQHLSVENETSNYSDFRVIHVVSSYELMVAYWDTCSVGKLDWYDRDIFVTEGQYCLVRMAGCTAGDQLRVYVSGYRQTLPSYREAM